MRAGTCLAAVLLLVPEGDELDTVLFVSQKANNEIVFSRWNTSGRLSP